MTRFVASRKEQKEALRIEREQRAAEMAAEERARRFRGYAIAGTLVAAAVAAIVVAVASSGGGGGGSTKNLASFYPKVSTPPSQGKISAPQAARSAGCTIRTHPGEGHDHTTDTVKYQTNPPSSGDHAPAPASDGAYSGAPPIGNLVHALEHGRVIIWFKPSAPPKVRGELKALFDEGPKLLVLAPNTTGMPYEVAASAWSGDRGASPAPPEVGYVLGCPRMTDTVFDALRAFIAEHRGKGPERINQPE
jgi:hypothetical protein